MAGRWCVRVSTCPCPWLSASSLHSKVVNSPRPHRAICASTFLLFVSSSSPSPKPFPNACLSVDPPTYCRSTVYVTELLIPFSASRSMNPGIWVRAR
ncbi:hypothetical protein BDW66DRAFT_133044 [Aspergillus desertorum]